MMNPTIFDPIALEMWHSAEENDHLLQTELESYLLNYNPILPSESTAETVSNLYPRAFESVGA